MILPHVVGSGQGQSNRHEDYVEPNSLRRAQPGNSTCGSASKGRENQQKRAASRGGRRRNLGQTDGEATAPAGGQLGAGRCPPATRPAPSSSHCTPAPPPPPAPGSGPVAASARCMDLVRLTSVRFPADSGLRAMLCRHAQALPYALKVRPPSTSNRDPKPFFQGLSECQGHLTPRREDRGGGGGGAQPCS